MDDTERTTPPPTGSVQKKTGRGMLWVLLAVVIAFLIGFVWQWYEASTVRDELALVEGELEVQRLRVQLGQAALAAQAGDFESSRRQMSSFFTQLQEQTPELPGEVATVANDFLNMRDEVITGLSRSNPEYAGVLYTMLGRLGSAVEQEGLIGTMPAGPTAEPAQADSPETTELEAEPEADPEAADTGAMEGLDSVP